MKYKVDVNYDGQNLSDHKPVNLQTDIQSEMTKNKNITNFSHNWNNVTEEKIMGYKSLLNCQFQNFPISQEMVNCNNFQCMQHNDEIIDTLENFMSLIIECTNDTIGVKKHSNKQGVIPGWNSFVQPFKDKSIFWHNVWRDSGSPKHGQIAENRRLARAKYHWAIKQTKKEANNYILNKTADQLSNKSFNDFWKTIKKLKGNNKTIASVVDGKTTDDEISNRFRYLYHFLQ